MKPIGECSVLRMRPKKDIEYPLIRLPKEYKHLIGKRASIYELDKNKFLIFVDDSVDDRLYNQLYNHDSSLNGVALHQNHKLRTKQISKKKERADPAGLEPAIPGLEGRCSFHAEPRALFCFFLFLPLPFKRISINRAAMAFIKVRQRKVKRNKTASISCSSI